MKKILQSKQFWKGSLINFSGVVLVSWLLKSEGWQFIKGGTTFSETINNFELKSIWVTVAISVVITYFQVRTENKNNSVNL